MIYHNLSAHFIDIPDVYRALSLSLIDVPVLSGLTARPLVILVFVLSYQWSSRPCIDLQVVYQTLSGC